MEFLGYLMGGIVLGIWVSCSVVLKDYTKVHRSGGFIWVEYEDRVYDLVARNK